jgi:hypothetical protein
MALGVSSVAVNAPISRINIELQPLISIFNLLLDTPYPVFFLSYFFLLAGVFVRGAR